MNKENIKKYFELQAQADAIKEEMAQLKESIVNDMDSEGVSTYEVDGIKAQIVSKDTFKCDDELGMITYLKNNGFDKFVVEKIDTTSLNKELKKGLSLSESLSGMYTKTTAPSLTIKKVL
jgi:hypothetical protein